MKKTWWLTFVLVLTFMPVRAEDSNPAASRIREVEQTLLPTVLIKGDPSFKLAERMKHYNVPGIGIAVIQMPKISKRSNLWQLP